VKKKKYKNRSGHNPDEYEFEKVSLCNFSETLFKNKESNKEIQN
jgi:hypothetical protein